MQFKGVKYQFAVKPWQYTGKASWVFVSLPKKISKEIRSHFKHEEEGWGRLKATAQIGNTEWKTAIWFDNKADTYLLPLKAEIRKKENVAVDKTVKVMVWVKTSGGDICCILNRNQKSIRMKNHLIPVMLVFSIITIAGCNSDTCSHCMVKDSQGDLIKDYDEKCGTSDDVEEYERSASEDAVQYGGTFECITH